MIVKDLSAIPVLAPTLQPAPRRTNRQVALWVLGVMSAMALFALIMALATVHVRREHDYRTKKETSSAPALPDPSQLEGLGFLPPEVNMVAALQVAELSKDSEAKRLLEDPRPPLLEMLLGTVEKRARITIEDIDHVVLGAEIREKLPQVTVVIVTREPYDPAERDKALQPATPTLVRGKNLYRFDLNPGKGMLWCPQPRVLVLLLRLDALTAADLDAIPLSPRQGAEAPPRAIQAYLAEQRIDRQSLAWAAGVFDGQNAFKDLLALSTGGGELASLVGQLQSFTLSLSSHSGLKLVGDFKARNSVAASRLQKQLEKNAWPKASTVKVVLPIPADPSWVRWVVSGDVDSIRAILGKGMSEP
jgi:hypothetical protein